MRRDRARATRAATLAVVLGTIALAAMAACLLPARQATGMDPAEVLRGE